MLKRKWRTGGEQNQWGRFGSVRELEEVSTTCYSGWVPASRSSRTAVHHPPSQWPDC